ASRCPCPRSLSARDSPAGGSVCGTLGKSLVGAPGRAGGRVSGTTCRADRRQWRRLGGRDARRAPLGSPVGSAAFAETTDLDLGAAVLHRAPFTAVVAAEVEKQPGAIRAAAQPVVPVGEDQLRGGVNEAVERCPG